MNGSPKPVSQYHIDEQKCPGNSKPGHSSEQFSEPDSSLKNGLSPKTAHTYEWFSKPYIHSMIRLQISFAETRVQLRGLPSTTL
jgi:hypothetical protein